MIVLDASAAVELLLRTPTGARVAGRIGARAESLHAPHLIDVEVLHVLRRLSSLGHLPALDAEQAISDLGGLGLSRYPHDPFLARIWELRSSVSAYDATYLALAEALAAPLLTADRRLARARGHRAVVELI